MEYPLLFALKCFLSLAIWQGPANTADLTSTEGLTTTTAPYEEGGKAKYIDLHGDIGGDIKVLATLCLFPDSSIQGQYYYDQRGEKNEHQKPFYRMMLFGKVHNGEVDLREMDPGGRQLGQFIGHFGSDEMEEMSFTGMHHDLFSGKDLNFYLSGNVFSEEMDHEQRYAQCGTQLNDHEVEFFAHRIRNLVLSRNSESFIKAVQFPLLVQDAKGKTRKIKKAEQLREEFADLFNSETLAALGKSSYTMLPCNKNGIRLGGVILLQPNENKGLSVVRIMPR